MFSKIGCDATAIMDMLGGHAGVTDSTVLQYLGIVEQRTNELLQLQAFIQAKVHFYSVFIQLRSILVALGRRTWVVG